MQRVRKTGGAAPAQTAGHEDELVRIVEAGPNITLAESQALPTPTVAALPTGAQPSR